MNKETYIKMNRNESHASRCSTKNTVSRRKATDNASGATPCRRYAVQAQCIILKSNEACIKMTCNEQNISVEYKGTGMFQPPLH